MCAFYPTYTILRPRFKKRKQKVMTQPPPSATALRVAALDQNSKNTFSLRPEATELKRIAQELDLFGLRKLSFEGYVQGEGAQDWRLSGKLGATVVQPCVVTLEPVSTRIDVPVTRHYARDYIDIDAPEAEMPEDETVEPLGKWIDPAEVMIEALVLALPLYPRMEGATLGESVHTEPGLAPMRDEDAKPFAGLASLKDQLNAGKDPDPET